MDLIWASPQPLSPHRSCKHEPAHSEVTCSHQTNLTFFFLFFHPSLLHPISLTPLFSPLYGVCCSLVYFWIFLFCFLPLGRTLLGSFSIFHLMGWLLLIHCSSSFLCCITLSFFSAFTFPPLFAPSSWLTFLRPLSPNLLSKFHFFFLMSYLICAHFFIFEKPFCKPLLYVFPFHVLHKYSALLFLCHLWWVLCLKK